VQTKIAARTKFKPGSKESGEGANIRT